MGKVIFFHCSYIQCNILPINTQLTALYLCPVLLHAAITVYLARSKMQSNNVICSLPLIARIYLQIRGGFKYITFLNMGWVFSDNFWNFVFVVARNQNLLGSVPCVWALCHCSWHDSFTKWSSTQPFLSILIFCKDQSWHLQSGSTASSQLQCGCPWEASLFQSHLHPTAFAMSSSEMLPLVWAAKPLSVCPCSGTPHTARGQPWGLSPHGELDKCFMLHRTWVCAMPWADVAFSGCPGSCKYVFIGHAHCLARVWSKGALFSGAAKWPRRAEMAPGLLSPRSSPCVRSRPWPFGWMSWFTGEKTVLRADLSSWPKEPNGLESPLPDPELNTQKARMAQVQV